MPARPAVICPQCGGLLQKVHVQADGSTRCTSCSHVFQVDVPLPADDLTAPSLEKGAAPVSLAVSAPQDEDIPGPRAQYGFLIVAGALLLIASVAGSALLAYLKFFPWLYATSERARNCWIPGLIAALPLLGALCFLLLCRVGWLDGQVHRLAALVGTRISRMPSMEGSSLPLILPWMVSGGLTVIIPVTLLLQGDQRAPLAALAIPIGVLLFAIGLALDEFRRFLARMSWAADCVTLAQPRQEAPVAVFLRMGLELLTPYTMVITALLAGALSAAALWESIQVDEDILICLFSALIVGMMGGAYSLYRISKNLALVVAKGERVARLLNINRLGSPFTHSHQGGALFIALLPVYWSWCLVIGHLSSLDFLFRREPWIHDLPGLERWTGLILVGAVVSATLWLSGMWLLLHRALCSLRAVVESTLPRLDAWMRPVFIPATVAAICALLLLLIAAAVLVFKHVLPLGLAMAILAWGALVMLIGRSSELLDTRSICVVLTFPALAVLTALGWVPLTPEFMGVIGLTVSCIGFATSALSVESTATSIERTRESILAEDL